MIELDKLFSKCKQYGTYLRVDSKHPNDIYIGYNDDFQKSIVIIGHNKNFMLKSTKNIRVYVTLRNDKKYSVEFSLIEDKYSSVFYKYCEDIIISSRNVPTHDVIAHTVERWKIWKALFNKPIKEILSLEKIKGLIGELLFLKNYMAKMYSTQKAINSWCGPEGNPKDFLINQTWYEVKTINESKKNVNISSLEQLDSIDYGYLIVVRLQNTSKEYSRHIELNMIVDEIINQITDIDVLEVFLSKLSNVGYQFHLEYSEYCFEYKSTIIYKVGDNFPRIARNILPKEIVNVSYDLLITNLESKEVLKWNY